MKITKILIAVDFSESCQNAVKYISDLVTGTDIRVSLIHVFSLSLTEYSSYLPSDKNDLIHKRMEKHVESLTALRDNGLPESNRGEIYARYGVYPTNETISKAAANNYDLIVTAMRQKYSLIDRLIGTVTASIFSNSDIPVLAIPNGTTFNNSNSLLHPTSEKYSGSYLNETGGEVSKLSAISELFKIEQIYIVHVEQGDGLEIKYTPQDNSSLHFVCYRADTAHEGIFDVISKYEINIIAIRKTDRSFWERLYHNSLTRKLLFQSRTPILVFS